jgi:transposase-like protein
MGTENTGQSRRKYDKEFKLEALRLVAEVGE